METSFLLLWCRFAYRLQSSSIPYNNSSSSNNNKMMDFTGVHFLASEKVQHFYNTVGDIVANPEVYCELEQSEAYQQLGVAQYYEGKYREALSNHTHTTHLFHVELKQTP